MTPLLLLALLPQPAPAPVTMRTPGAVYRVYAADRRVTATLGGRTITVLDGFGPVPVTPTPPSELQAARLVAGRLDCTYGTGDAAWLVRIAPRGDALSVELQSAAAHWDRVRTGQALAPGEWRRVNFTRNAEPYGQPWWPRVAVWPGKGIAMTAQWSPEVSNGSSWDAPDQRFSGEGAFAAGLDVSYTPAANGRRLPVRERLIVRVGRTLWQAAPPPPQAPSAYRRDLAGMVFLDAWGGRAPEVEYLLGRLGKLTAGRTRFLTVLENWQAGGFDSLLPDSILMPDYPPNPGIGTIPELQALARKAKSMGRFALRTNYLFLRDGAPSVRAGRVHAATGADGKPAWFTRPTDWPALVRRQEREIRGLFGTTAGFSDQIGSAGSAWGYTDWDGVQPGSPSMGATVRRVRNLCDIIRSTNSGPLGSETVIDEGLVGPWLDYGDFGIFDGHNRLFTPEFKLRRLQGLTAVHGMGLMYRFFENPPFALFSSGKSRFYTDRAWMDDYRATEVLYGNGGYLFWYPGMPWDYVMTECVVLPALQRRYCLAGVREVLYDQEGKWVHLDDLLAAGIDPLPVPWNPQAQAFRHIRVVYSSGLAVEVNRGEAPVAVIAGKARLQLPRYGWAAWTTDGTFLAYSAEPVGGKGRIDYMEDRPAQLRYVDPRGTGAMGAAGPTLWVAGRKAAVLDPSTGDAVIEGKPSPNRPPRLRTFGSIDFRGAGSLGAWSGLTDLSPLRFGEGHLSAEIVGADPALLSPELRVSAASVRTIVLKATVTSGTMGQLYFRRSGDEGTSEERCVHFDVAPSPGMQVIRIPVAQHPLWNGTIVQLRLDPEHGASPGQLAIESITAE